MDKVDFDSLKKEEDKKNQKDEKKKEFVLDLSQRGESLN